MGLESQNLSEQGVVDISTRLAADEGLRMPGNLTREGKPGPDQAKRQEYLGSLLRRDPGVFLERYAEQLTPAERTYFEPLRGDYEVDFYLKLAAQAPAAAKPSSVQVKNRRLAQMNRLSAAGEYFSEEAMRERAPLLHHQYIGQYEPSAPPGRRTNKLSDSILRQHDEVETRLRLAQQREAEAMVEEETESDSDDAASEEGRDAHDEARPQPASQAHATLSGAAEGQHAQPLHSETTQSQRPDPDKGHGGGHMGGAQPHSADSGAGAVPDEAEQDKAGAAVHPAPVPISAEERASNREEFLEIMRGRFLGGQDGEFVDYAAIDRDSTLDDDWVKQQQQDAEDAYFESV